MFTCEGCAALHRLLGYLRACDAVRHVEEATNAANATNLRELIAEAQRALDAHELREHRFIAAAYGLRPIPYPLVIIGVDEAFEPKPKGSK